jgi:hypothetical protein
MNDDRHQVWEEQNEAPLRWLRKLRQPGSDLWEPGARRGEWVVSEDCVPRWIPEGRPGPRVDAVDAPDSVP